MPHSDLHKKKLSKNLIMLALIMGFIALIWMITMIKIAQAEGTRDPMTATHSVDTVTSYIDEREEHIEGSDERLERWWYDDLSQSVNGDDDRTTRPTQVQNERKLRNTFNHNRSTGGMATVTQ